MAATDGRCVPSGAIRASRPGGPECALIVLVMMLTSGSIFVIWISGATTGNKVFSDVEREWLHNLYLPADLAAAPLLLPILRVLCIFSLGERRDCQAAAGSVHDAEHPPGRPTQARSPSGIP
jgi:hypothetical protein